MAPPSFTVLATSYSSPSPSSFSCVSTFRTPEPRPRSAIITRLRLSSPPPRVPRRWRLYTVAEQRAETEGVGKKRNYAMAKEPVSLGSYRSKGRAEFMERAASNNTLDESAEGFSVADWSQMLCCFDQRNLRASHIWGGLKFALLLALFTSQVSPQALAGTEFPGAQLTSYIGDVGDITTGFASVRKASLQLPFPAFLLIFFSELGDKTFFIAALLAARNSGAVVFLGTFGALAAMTIVSVVLGRTFHYVDDILPFRFGEADFPIDDFAAVCLLGVVKNIIPAIASTNAIISATCALEALKIVSGCSKTLSNYLTYNGMAGTHIKVTDFVREDCLVCGPGTLIEVDPSITLAQFIEILGEHPQLLLLKTSVTYRGNNLYMQSPPVLEELTRENLHRPLFELMGKVTKDTIHVSGTSERNGKKKSCLTKLRVAFKGIIDQNSQMDETAN